MPTEEYKGWKPWVCRGCSRELQFSERYGSILQLLCLGVALVSLYLLGFRGWRLALLTIVTGAVLAIVLGGPLGRILPPKLEPYRPPPWRYPSRPADGSTLGLNTPDATNQLAPSNQEKEPRSVE